MMVLAGAVQAIDFNGDGNVEGLEIFFTGLSEIALVLAALFIIFKYVVKGPLNLYNSFKQFASDWEGEPERDGYDAKPGVKHRLQASEELLTGHIAEQAENMKLVNKNIADNFDAIEKVGTQVDTIEQKIVYELDRNGGGSTKDAAHEALRIVKKVADQQKKDNKQREIWHTRYMAQLRRMEQDRAEVFIGIKDMIGKPVEEQAAMWDDLTAPFIRRGEDDPADDVIDPEDQEL